MKTGERDSRKEARVMQTKEENVNIKRVHIKGRHVDVTSGLCVCFIHHTHYFAECPVMMSFR
jgi:hypothetical protein